MFKSIFTKYLIAFTALLACGFLMLLMIFGSVLGNYSEDTKEAVVREAAVQTARGLSEMYGESSGGSFSAYLKENDRAVRRLLTAVVTNSDDIFIIAADTETDVLIVSDSDRESDMTEDVCRASANAALAFLGTDGTDTPQRLPDEKNGEGQEYACCMAVRDAEGRMVGVVTVISESGDWADLNVTPLKSASVAAIWVLVAAVIALYFLTEKVIDPLREMSRAAKRMAVGKFDTRIHVRGRDEVAELAVAFNQMAESLQNLDRMRNSFIANVSHDLRTPMTTIIGFIDGILEGVIPPEEQAHYLGVVLQEVKRLSRLVNELLDISRLQAGDRKLTMKSFDICEMGRLILISFEQKIDDKHLDVSFDCDEDRMFVLADSDAIHQILYNITDNAVKFAREGGRLAMRFRWEEGGIRTGRKAVVSVFNEGPGIPPEDIPFIFERFYKSDKSRGVDKSGVGLGMYIAKTIIDAHDETISVQSEYGKNCEFIFTLTEGEEPVRGETPTETDG